MTSYRHLTATEISNPTCSYVTDDGAPEVSVLVQGTVTATGQPIQAIVLIDTDGHSLDSPDAFTTADGIDNFEMACSAAAEGHTCEASLRGLLECDCRTLAEQFAILS